MSDTPVQPGAPTVGADAETALMAGRVIDVNEDTYTATVKTTGAGRTYSDLPIGSPYFHYERGEGWWALPDIGAPCLISTESSGGSPVILSFVNLPKPVSSSERTDPNAPARPGDETMVSYASRRPRRVRGEFGMTSRDGSFLNFRRGGIVELGANGACQRLFIPLSNHLVDVCEGYKLVSAAGTQVFDSDRVEEGSGQQAKTVWRIIAKANAGDQNGSKEGSVMLEAGNLGDGRFRLVVAPVGIDLKDGSYTGDRYSFEIDVNGNLNEKASNVTRTCGQLDLTVDGELNETSGSRKSVVKGDWIISVLNSLTVTALSATFTGAVTVQGAMSVLGGFISPGSGGANMNLDEFLRRYASHTHAAPGAPALPPNLPPPPWGVGLPW